MLSIEFSVRFQQGPWLSVTSNILIAMTSRIQLRWPSSLLPMWQCHSDTEGLLREFQMLSLSFDTLSPVPHGNWGVMRDPFLKADLNWAAYFLASLSAAEPCTSIHY